MWQREKEPELYDAIQAIAPEWWGDDTRIILNKDLVAKRHKDGNKGHSWCLWLGDSTRGGGLNFDDGSKIEGKYQWFKIDGQIHHWNDPHEGGTKYSIVLFRSDKKPKSNVMNEARLRKIAKENAENTKVISESSHLFPKVQMRAQILNTTSSSTKPQTMIPNSCLIFENRFRA